MEARNETFPLTLAFLRLLDALTDSELPAGLGVGLRAPGITPYIDFVRDSVFLKFYTRAYKDPAEKVNQILYILCILTLELSHAYLVYWWFPDENMWPFCKGSFFGKNILRLHDRYCICLL